MRIDSAILSNAIITASVESPVVSGSSQVNITQTTGYSAFSSSIQTYTNAKVSALVESAPGALDTLNELAAALGDDANLSASIATTIGDKLATSTHTAFSSSNASALRAEYVASTSALSASAHTRREQISASLDATIDALDSLGISTDTERGALSSSAHTQREAIKGLATSANNSLSSSKSAALRTEYKAGDTALSSSAHTQREAIKGLATSANNSLSSSKATALRAEYVAGDAALSASAHTQRAAIDAKVGALDSTYATDASVTSLSSSAHTQREAIKGLATSANNTLSGSSAGALRTEYKAGDTALSSSAHTQREAIKGLATTANNSLSGSSAGALRTEYVAGDSALSASAEVRRNQLHALQLLSSSVGATINDNAVKLAGIETGATADQSAAEILTAIKTVDGAASGLDADTLDGEQGAYYAPSASMKTYVDAKVAGVVDSSPAALNTLNELAAALGDDANFSTTVSTSIGEKLVIASNLSDLNNAATARTNLGVAKGIADGNVLAANDAVADNDFLRIDGTEVEGLTAAEVRSALNVEDGATADQTAAEIRTAIGTGNNGVVPSTGTAGHFLKHDGTFGLPSYTTNTDTVDMGSGFTVSATTDTTATTITEGDDLFFAAGVGIQCETTADGTVTITNTVTDTNTQLSTADVRGKFSAGTNVSITDGEISSTDTNTVTSFRRDNTGTYRTGNINLVGGTNVTISEGSAGVFTIASTDTNTDTNDDVSVANLKTRLAGPFGSNAVTIGDSDDIVTIGHQLSVTSHATMHCLGVGTAASTTEGEIRATGDITAYYSSDERLKENFAPLTGALDKVKAIGGYEFDWKDGIEDATSKTGHDIGVKAQELQAQYPELVHERDNGYLAVDYIKLNAVLIEAVKELAAKVDKLEK